MMETVTTSCATCGLKFPMAKWLYILYEKSGECFTCPQGHESYVPGNAKSREDSLKWHVKQYDFHGQSMAKMRRRESALRGLQGVGFTVTAIRDVTPIPHNGCRPKKRRRV